MTELVSQRIPFQVDPPVACEATSTLHMCCGDVDGLSTNVCGDCGRQTNLDKLGLLSGSVSIVISVCFVLGLWPLDPWPCSKMFATFLKVCSAVPATMRPTCQELTCPRVHSKTELLPKRSSSELFSSYGLIKGWCASWNTLSGEKFATSLGSKITECWSRSTEWEGHKFCFRWSHFESDLYQQCPLLLRIIVFRSATT